MVMNISLNMFQNLLSHSLELRYEQEHPIIIFTSTVGDTSRRRVGVPKHFNRIKLFSAKDSGQ